MPKVDQKTAIEGEVLEAMSLQRQLDDTEAELMLDPRFKQFVALRDTVNQKWGEVRKNVEAVMVPAYQAGQIGKSIKGEWGSITVTESDRFEINTAELPPKFFKKVPDETKIRATYQLEGKAPKGTKQFKKFGIMMKFNKEA